MVNSMAWRLNASSNSYWMAIFGSVPCAMDHGIRLEVAIINTNLTSFDSIYLSSATALLPLVTNTVFMVNSKHICWLYNASRSRSSECSCNFCGRYSPIVNSSHAC